MIEVVSIFEDVSKDAAVIEQNGNLTISMFNRLSRRAELRLIDWLKGDPSGVLPPEPWTTQVLKDFLSPFIVKKETNMSSDGLLDRPDDYYRLEDFYRVGSIVEENKDCDDEGEPQTDDNHTVITHFTDRASFNNRCNTWIKGDKPTMKNPISTQYGRKFETRPKDLGPVVLEYIRYPLFASVKEGLDPVYNVPTAEKLVDYEWDEWAREPLIWFITDMFANRTSNRSTKEFNAASKKTVRE